MPVPSVSAAARGFSISGSVQAPPSLGLRELAIMIGLVKVADARDRNKVTAAAMEFLGDPEFDAGSANVIFQRLVDLKLVLRFGDDWAITPRGSRAMRLSSQYVTKVQAALLSFAP